jgi:hypothetical protein
MECCLILTSGECLPNYSCLSTVIDNATIAHNRLATIKLPNHKNVHLGNVFWSIHGTFFHFTVQHTNAFIVIKKNIYDPLSYVPFSLFTVHCVHLDPM